MKTKLLTFLVSLSVSPMYASSSPSSSSLKKLCITKETGRNFLFPTHVPDKPMPIEFAYGLWTQYTVHNEKKRKAVSYRKAVDPLCMDPHNCFIYVSGHPKNVADIASSNITRETYDQIEAQYRALVVSGSKKLTDLQPGAVAPVEDEKKASN